MKKIFATIASIVIFFAIEISFYQLEKILNWNHDGIGPFILSTSFSIMGAIVVYNLISIGFSWFTNIIVIRILFTSFGILFTAAIYAIFTHILDKHFSVEQSEFVSSFFGIIGWVFMIIVSLANRTLFYLPCQWCESNINGFKLWMIEIDKNKNKCELIEAKNKDEVQKLKYGIQPDKIYECEVPFTEAFFTRRKSEPNILSTWYSRQKVRVIEK